MCLQISSAKSLFVLSRLRRCSISELVQSSAVITRIDIIRYYINNYRNWCRISIRCWIHIDLWGVLCEYLWEKWPRYNYIALYSHQRHRGGWSTRDQINFLEWLENVINVCNQEWFSLYCQIIQKVCLINYWASYIPTWFSLNDLGPITQTI